MCHIVFLFWKYPADLYVSNKHLLHYTHFLSLGLIPKGHSAILRVNGDRPEELLQSVKKS